MEIIARLPQFIWVWLFYVPFVLVATLVTAFLSVLLAPIFGPSRISRWIVVPWARALVLSLPVKVNISGHWPITSGHSYVVVANHQSQFDIPLLYGWLNLDLRWIMKQEVMRIPGVGMGAKALGHIPINRRDGASARAEIQKALELLDPGTGLMFFPEGTRGKNGHLLKFKSGAFRTAIQQQIPLLPVTICGTREIMPPGRLRFRAGEVNIVVHEPITTRNMDETRVDELIESTRDWMQQQLNKHELSANSRLARGH